MQNLKNKDEAVVVFSGGQDSTTCLLWALKKYKKVYAVSFDYGQRHALELECAREIADKFGVEHHILDMSLLNQLAPNSLTRTDMKVDENAPDEGTPNSFVDGRNMVFLTFVAIFAKQRGISDIITPLMWIDKMETWKMADELGGLDVIRDMTLTCYNGIKGEGCGHCPSCKLRKKGYDLYMKYKEEHK